MVLGGIYGARFSDTLEWLLPFCCPFTLAGTGIVTRLYRHFCKVKDEVTRKSIEYGEIISSVVMIIASWFIIKAGCCPRRMVVQRPLYAWADPEKGALIAPLAFYCHGLSDWRPVC